MKYVKRVGNKKFYKPSYYEDNREEKHGKLYHESTVMIDPDYIQKCKYCSASTAVPVQADYFICKYCKRLIRNETKGRFKWIMKKNLKSG